MKAQDLMVLAAGMLLAVSSVHAGDASVGKAKSESCAQCHGDTGKDDPAIAGMAVDKFVKEMKAYQSGERKHRKMMKAATGLSDADLADMAAYYATLK